MLLGKYFHNINKDYKNFYFSGISFDTKNIKKNNIFFAIKGNKFDGNNFIPDAINKGSKIIVTEKKVKSVQNGILYIHTNNVRKLLAETAFKIYNKKPKNLIAVTGTNGKSSIANFYFQILKLNNKKVASIGTLGVKSKNINLNLSNTTIDPIKLAKILSKLKSHKIENVIMEASSHGLKQNRLDGLKFNSGIFTNLSQDHLDYHKNLKNYLNAKLYLFENLIKKKGNLITDQLIPEFKKIKKITINKRLKLYALNDKKNNLQVISHSFKGEAQSFKIKLNNSIQNINLNLIGKIQLKNVLMAIIAAKNSNIGLNKILNKIYKLKPVEGRFEKIGKIKNHSKVILDYAHTPDALKTCLLNLREQFPAKKIIVLFGCGGNRDQNKRSKMGKIASYFSDKIILTNDNPRLENPQKIRRDIKKGIKKKKIIEISDRAMAITRAIHDLNSGDILLVAGKGHEKTQDIGSKKIFFSDKKVILSAIKNKNINLSNNLKINVVKESGKIKRLSPLISLKKARINSQEVTKNDIFFAIKGKKNDGNKFVAQSFKRKASLAVVNKIQNKLNHSRQIKVKNTLKFLTNVSKIFRKSIDTNIIAITGSCGKTTLKELLGNTLNKISKVSISPKSYNNKFGVPLSLFNINQKDEFGILEVGMDKKGEIDYLSKIIEPDVGVITNINYAHAKNFKNIKQIALAKSEIIDNIRLYGFIVLNADDSFFKLHYNIAKKKNIKVISFGIKNHKADIKLINIKPFRKKFRINISLNNKRKYFLLSNDFQNNIYNILSALAVISIYKNIFKLDKNIFYDFKIPGGRGDHSVIKFNNKKINLIDQSYNSNPLSLKSAIKNYDKINLKKSNKYMLIGDMLELGSHSRRLHRSVAPIINKSNIDKVYVKGKMASIIFKDISKAKKGRILLNKSQIIELIRKDLNNNDYLMIKASLATGFNDIVKDLKGLR
ncbi:UDP-N-acetylmuramoylalanyl-D-glutamate [Candidatus Pelagibacter sp. HTCC7211]|uniref:UDP-N-acetylmuramoyl-L-alanyl-D-glutamate--2, 6-diaminopimelate ligase n=1 Tax=Pelagibacter sp. (strain HTCC7211) TaxID=439493 RepID=UPI0001838D13|nr:UDP-N-acetylmuramoyl-L-alanyl-D-glutamate--2,6-diaminopimelate ligase [Candidatus Pelagibacter sp. HTCC7211]EDZ60439.1 UDP-N-acetylmuramoylalanyl-D-glutamate [Candidatus Pelagibacter sp. HTCC7211]